MDSDPWPQLVSWCKWPQWLANDPAATQLRRSRNLKPNLKLDSRHSFRASRAAVTNRHSHTAARRRAILLEFQAPGCQHGPGAPAAGQRQ